MNALVVGGTGFVGMNVVRALVAAGHDVTATRRARSNTLFARKLGARLEHADLDDTASLVKVMRGRDVVFMCAGHYPRYSLDPEREIGLARARAHAGITGAILADVPRYVLTSSVATVGPPPPGRELSRECDLLPVALRAGAYHGAKIAIEDETLAVSARGDIHVVILCPTGIMGTLDVKAGTGFVVVALGTGRLPFYVPGKTNLVDADDVAAAHLAAATKGRPGDRYLVGGHNLTVRQLLRAIADELEISLASWPLPPRLAGVLATVAEMRVAAENRGGRAFLSRELVDVVTHGRWVDTTMATRELGLAPPVPLETTIRKACDWYRKNRYLPSRGSSPPLARSSDRVRATQAEAQLLNRPHARTPQGDTHGTGA